MQLVASFLYLSVAGALLLLITFAVMLKSAPDRLIYAPLALLFPTLIFSLNVAITWNARRGRKTADLDAANWSTTSDDDDALPSDGTYSHADDGRNKTGGARLHLFLASIVTLYIVMTFAVLPNPVLINAIILAAGISTPNVKANKQFFASHHKETAKCKDTPDNDEADIIATNGEILVYKWKCVAGTHFTTFGQWTQLDN